MKKRNRLCCLLLALTMAFSLWGCASAGVADDPSGTDDTTLGQENPAVDTTDSKVEFGPKPIGGNQIGNEGTDAGTIQLRLRGMNEGWKAQFSGGEHYILVASASELQDLVSSKLIGQELDLDAYDDSFFAENRLVLIPRSSNSGSVTYQAKVAEGDGGITISLDARMPEFGTADMADWLVLVTLPNETYEAMEITVRADSNGSGTGTASK